MSKTITEKYIEKAVKAAKDAGIGGHSLSNCTVNMPFEMGDAAKELAQAINSQAKANEMNSKAMLELAEKLTVGDACAIRIES